MIINILLQFFKQKDKNPLQNKKTEEISATISLPFTRLAAKIINQFFRQAFGKHKVAEAAFFISIAAQKTQLFSSGRTRIQALKMSKAVFVFR